MVAARATAPGIRFEVGDLRDWVAGDGRRSTCWSPTRPSSGCPTTSTCCPGWSGRCAPAAGSRSRSPATSTSPATRSAPSWPPSRRTPRTPRASRSRQPRPGDVPRRARRGSAARSTCGRRRTSTSSPARTRCSPGSPAPAPGRRSRRCPTTCGRSSRRSSSAGSRRPTPSTSTASCCRSAGSSWSRRCGGMRLHHVQVACPPGGEDGARRFYGDGLGMTEVEKPDDLRGRGGAWFRAAARRDPRRRRGSVRPGAQGAPGAGRRRPGGRRRDRLAALGFEVDWSQRHTFPGYERFHTFDGHGNRVEVLGSRLTPSRHAPGPDRRRPPRGR